MWFVISILLCIFSFDKGNYPDSYCFVYVLNTFCVYFTAIQSKSEMNQCAFICRCSFKKKTKNFINQF